MKDTLTKAANEVSVESFKTTLIISEIVITALVLYGFYLIFNNFNKKNKAFRNEQSKKN
jgi:hypothetical protein